MDYPGLGLVDPKSQQFTDFAEAMARQHGVRFEFTTEVSFGYADEVSGVIRLNPNTATWTVLNHEVSHVHFYQAMGKWMNGQKLTNFELNLMESIGYHETYLEGKMFGVAKSTLLEDTAFGAAFSRPAVQAIIRSNSPAVSASLEKGIRAWGRDFVEDALRCQGRGLHPRKQLKLP